MHFLKRFGKLDGDFQIIIVVLLLLVVGLFTTALHTKDQKVALTPEAIAEAEMKSIVTELSAMIVLPQEEIPTVATVSDAEVLKSQPFFTNSERGDKVLIYAAARKAILWRPSTHKIIEVSELNPSK